jgi:thioredoxin reductase (NADPH)
MIYDTIIAGMGPAGLSASIYASRYFLNHIVIGKELGGTMARAHKIENYPGIETISGLDLANKMFEQAKKLGSEFILNEIKNISKDKNKNYFEIHTAKTLMEKKEPYQAYNLIFAIGMKHRTLGVPGEIEFQGKGISYCSICDAAFFKDKEAVAVIGGGNAATMSAMHLSEYAKKVYLIYRKDQLKGEPAWNKKVEDNPKVEIIYNTNVTEIKGESIVKQILLDQPYEGKKSLDVNGLFIEIGHTPSISLAKKLGLELDEQNFIIVDEFQKTSLEGVMAAGDITSNIPRFRQVVTAVRDGALAAKTAFEEKMKREVKAKAKIDYR